MSHVRRLRAQGTPDLEIEHQLLRSGWPRPLVRKALRGVQPSGLRRYTVPAVVLFAISALLFVVGLVLPAYETLAPDGPSTNLGAQAFFLGALYFWWPVGWWAAWWANPLIWFGVILRTWLPRAGIAGAIVATAAVPLGLVALTARTTYLNENLDEAPVEVGPAAYVWVASLLFAVIALWLPHRREAAAR
ncbi:hypothetical protein ACHAAC_04390 [Aeromicrobium sp. CF4.19]|uniref:hypothetical protein n=1 Tax=Aeromicrobium sp. CF4.19 TaxID=3373082 RepID=UPI003EE4A562